MISEAMVNGFLDGMLIAVGIMLLFEIFKYHRLHRKENRMLLKRAIDLELRIITLEGKMQRKEK